MEYKYDQDTDILIIKISDDGPDFGEQRENIIYHYSKNGIPVEIEILEASKTALNIVGAIQEVNKES
tara:strand:- start:116 stop:316 length:201 start_codon:yes stop_codon:yes gene_type:complete